MFSLSPPHTRRECPPAPRPTPLIGVSTQRRSSLPFSAPCQRRKFDNVRDRARPPGADAFGRHTAGTATYEQSISLVTTAEGKYPFPFRTRKSSPPAPMVLPSGGRVGRRQTFFVSAGVLGDKKPVVQAVLRWPDSLATTRHSWATGCEHGGALFVIQGRS